MRLFILFFYFTFSILTPHSDAQIIPFAFFKTLDPCSGTPTIGATCSGGALYAGQFDGGKYMVTPSGCTDSSTPICAGGVDTLTKIWRGSTGSYANVTGVENVISSATPSASSFRGNVNTSNIVVHFSISSDSAADFCNDMTYGGYSDWSLPSKSELAYIYCHWNAPSPLPGYPLEDADCTSYGSSSELTGFQGDYWASTEGDPSFTNLAWTMNFVNGSHGKDFKNKSVYKIRCIRRY